MRGSAAEIRHLVPVLARLTETRVGTAPQVHRHLALRSLARDYDVLEASGVHMTNEEVAAVRPSVQEFLEHYKRLSLNAARRGILSWQVIPKHNFFWHIGEQARWMNPRLGWAYQWENMIQEMLRVHRACAAGTPPHKIGHHVMMKYRAARPMHLSQSS